MSERRRIVPVILSGGIGARLWPMSREHFPKQLLPLAGPRSMICETLARFSDPETFARPIVMTNDELRFSVAEQLHSRRIEATIVLESAARNTAPAIAAAALLAMEEDPDAILLAVPSDHIIRDVPEFLARVGAALSAAQAGFIVTFGLRPTRAECGYGYIEMGDPIAAHPGLYEVARFSEKPSPERARQFFEGGRHYWNGGMFLFSARRYWAELQRYAEPVTHAVKAAVAGRRVDLDFVRLDPDFYAAAPNISIDYAVMERTEVATTVICNIGWTDVGSWSELWEIADKDINGNVIQGDVVAEGATNSYLRSDAHLTAAVGVDNLIVVVTDDAVLVTSRGQDQYVKLIVDRLRRDRRRELLTHARVERPWGFYQSLHQSDRFQVKRLSIKPGARIPMQRHFHRAEHWVVVDGTARVTRGTEEFVLGENESIYVMRGASHRLENPGNAMLNVIEVQSGEILSEDDIVRMEDVYGQG